MIFFMLLNMFVDYVAFADRKDALLGNQKPESIIFDASGSLGLFYDGKCHKTSPNHTAIANEKMDWCSNIKTNEGENPWIQVSLKNQQMKVKSYSIRNGCCNYDYCCAEDGSIVDRYCCCLLYSFSLHASNDNKTWKVIHKVDKDRTFHFCEAKTYTIKEPALYTYYKFVLDEEFPGCLKCLQINQFEFYGDAVSVGYTHDGNYDEDESVSIIGRVKKGEQ